jgi:hypothetical protein
VGGFSFSENHCNLTRKKRFIVGFHLFSTLYDFLYRHDPDSAGAFGGGDIPDGILLIRKNRHPMPTLRGSGMAQ